MLVPMRSIPVMVPMGWLMLNCEEAAGLFFMRLDDLLGERYVHLGLSWTVLSLTMDYSAKEIS